MNDTVIDPWAEYQAIGRRIVLLGVVLVCLGAIAIGNGGVVMVAVGVVAAAVTWAGISDWLGQRAQRKRVIGLTIMGVTLAATTGFVGVLAMFGLFLSGWRLFGVHLPGTLPQRVRDPRVGWRLASTWGGAVIALDYGRWALDATRFVPVGFVLKGAVAGLLISLVLVPFIATFREFDVRWTFAARCLLLVAVFYVFNFLHDVLPDAYVIPIDVHDYGIRAELWAFVSALFAGLSASVYFQLPSRRYFAIRRGRARELGRYLYPSGARRRERAFARATALFARRLRAMSLAPGRTWTEMSSALAEMITTLETYTDPRHDGPVPHDLAVAGATISEANARLLAELRRLAEILRDESSDDFIAWKMRFDARGVNRDSLEAMRTITEAAVAAHVAPPRQLLVTVRFQERSREREQMELALKAASAGA